MRDLVDAVVGFIVGVFAHLAYDNWQAQKRRRLRRFARDQHAVRRYGCETVGLNGCRGPT